MAFDHAELTMATRLAQSPDGPPYLANQPPESWRLGFWSLIVTQFQGAFNDNGLKFLVIYLIIGRNFPIDIRDRLVLLVGTLFALPFIIFAMAGGYLADHYSKRSVTIGTKVFEIGVMLFAFYAFARGNLYLEATAVFLISTQGALFAPSKYGLLPELLPQERLSWGNGVIELGTFIAAITATMASGFLAGAFRGRQAWSGAIFLGLTVLGLLTSLGISRVPAADPKRKFRANPLADFFSLVPTIRRDRVLAWAVVGNTYLWFLAALLQFVIVIYGHDILHVDETQISYLQAAVGIGIGFGSLAAGYLSFGTIENGFVPLGAIGMTLFSFLVSMNGAGIWQVRMELALLGVSGGFYAVPLNALIQHRPPREHKGGVIAAANLLSFVGVFLAAGVYFLLSSALQLNPAQIFMAGALMTLASAFYSIFLLPDSVRDLRAWIEIHALRRQSIGNANRRD
jgi:acyl-[acyl-carrier-protein]-phospholipid O-acyltransferase/long-chain-fatty-acid--[acyl-carrier-protein] ligase